MKLSKTGWNNVIIFSVMAMILLINVMDKKLLNSSTDTNTTNKSSASNALLGEQAVVLTLAVNDQLLIERIGSSWRSTPAKLSGQALDQMMLSWQQVSGTVVLAPESIEGNGIIVTVNLAGNNDSVVLTLYALANEVLVYHHNQQLWYAVPLPLLSQLLPVNIIS